MGQLLTTEHDSTLCIFLNTSTVRVVCKIIPLVNLDSRDLETPDVSLSPDNKVIQLTSIP